MDEHEDPPTSFASDSKRSAAYRQIVPWRSLRVIMTHAIAIGVDEVELIPWKQGWVIMRGPLANGEYGDYELLHQRGSTWWHELAPYEPWFDESDLTLTDADIEIVVQRFDRAIREEPDGDPPEHISSIVRRVFSVLEAGMADAP